MHPPALPEQEALANVARVCAAIEEGRSPLTDGVAGLRVLAVLDATSRSLAVHGDLVPVESSSDLVIGGVA